MIFVHAFSRESNHHHWFFNMLTSIEKLQWLNWTMSEEQGIKFPQVSQNFSNCSAPSRIIVQRCSKDTNMKAARVSAGLFEVKISWKGPIFGLQKVSADETPRAIFSAKPTQKKIYYSGSCKTFKLVPEDIWRFKQQYYQIWENSASRNKTKLYLFQKFQQTEIFRSRSYCTEIFNFLLTSFGTCPGTLCPGWWVVLARETGALK